MTNLADRTFAVEPTNLLPAITPDNMAFWSALQDGRLVMQHCPSCQRFRYPIVPVCPYCSATRFGWRDVSGRGRVFSWVRYHRSFLPEFEPLMPYVVATVELEEGPRMFGLIKDTHEPPVIGSAVDLVVEKWPDGRCVPAFKSVAEKA